MEDKKYNDVDNISFEELELIRNLSHMECIDEGIYPMLDFVIDMDDEEEKI